MDDKKYTAKNIKTHISGINLSMLNAYGRELNKRIRELENQLNDDNLVTQSLEATEDITAYISQLEQQIRDVEEEISSDKEIYAFLEKQCQRLQDEIEQLQMQVTGNFTESIEDETTRPI
jgi:chromosome segregation ATPase